jgi:UDP-glucose 4-epimerase
LLPFIVFAGIHISFSLNKPFNLDEAGFASSAHQLMGEAKFFFKKLEGGLWPPLYIYSLVTAFKILGESTMVRGLRAFCFASLFSVKNNDVKNFIDKPGGKMANILVTGGGGFIGSHIVDELIKDGNKVIVLDDLSGGFVENVNKKAIFVEGSILDAKLLSRIFSQHQFDYIFHLAAYAAEGLSHFIKRFNYSNNLIGSVNLINESVLHKVKCFVFTSSIAVYGSLKAPMREDMMPHPDNSYGIAKFAVEQELKISKETFGLNYIIFRTHNVYGERQNIGDKYRNVIGIFMNQIMQKQPMTVFGDGTQTRAFSYIGDVAPVMAGSVKERLAYGEIFNLGAEKPYSIIQLAEAVAMAMGIKPDICYLKPRNEVRNAYCDHSKVKKLFGESKSVSLKEGISRMARWAHEIGPRKNKKFGNMEIMQNLPERWLEDFV